MRQHSSSVRHGFRARATRHLVLFARAWRAATPTGRRTAAAAATAAVAAAQAHGRMKCQRGRATARAESRQMLPPLLREDKQEAALVWHGSGLVERVDVFRSPTPAFAGDHRDVAVRSATDNPFGEVAMLHGFHVAMIRLSGYLVGWLSAERRLCGSAKPDERI